MSSRKSTGGRYAREKGKRIERFFKDELQEFFPDIRRNAGTQSQSGGVDLENTNPFDFEVKGGKQGNVTKVLNWIEQVRSEGKDNNLKAVLIKPERVEPYVIMPFDDFKKMLGKLVN